MTKLKIETIKPDDKAFQNVERDYPNKSAAEKHRLAQADTLLRLYRERKEDEGRVAER
jgi:hypothetical protein